MKLAGILAGILLFVLLAVLLVAYFAYRIAFYVPKRKPRDPEIIELPRGKHYDPFRPLLTQWVQKTRLLPYEAVQIRSADDLKLTGKFYEYAPGAPIEVMFHGYRGNSERDLSGGVLRAFSLGHSVLLPDHRCSGDSQGHTITFGILEHNDCLRWVDFAVNRFGPDCRVLLTGISMGAATVLMAAGQPLPPNVVGILADCGYTSPRQILRTVIANMGLPVGLGYFMVRLGAAVYGNFDTEQTSALEAMGRCRVPVLFFHGEADALVPCHMSREMYEACTARKKLVTVPDAGHGLCYVMDPQTYIAHMQEFFPV